MTRITSVLWKTSSPKPKKNISRLPYLSGKYAYAYVCGVKRKKKRKKENGGNKEKAFFLPSCDFCVEQRRQRWAAAAPGADTTRTSLGAATARTPPLPECCCCRRRQSRGLLPRPQLTQYRGSIESRLSLIIYVRLGCRFSKAIKEP